MESKGEICRKQTANMENTIDATTNMLLIHITTKYTHCTDDKRFPCDTKTYFKIINVSVCDEVTSQSLLFINISKHSHSGDIQNKVERGKQVYFFVYLTFSPISPLFTASVLYYYFYKRTAEYLGDPRLYEDSPWLRDVFAQVRQ